MGLLTALASSARADVVVPANAAQVLNGGTLDLSCTDLVVAGTLLLAGGNVTNARNVVVQPGGVLDGTGGTIALGGDWTNAGTFVAGAGSVQFRDSCSLTVASIGGETTFASVSFLSSSGKTYSLASGATQRVTSGLQIAGVTGTPILFRSSIPGQAAFLNLGLGGNQAIQSVGVTDVWSTGQWLAPGLTNQNGANAKRWFGQSDDGVQVIPTIGREVLAVLLGLLALTGACIGHRRGTFRRG